MAVRSALVTFFMDSKRWQEAERLLRGNLKFHEKRNDSIAIVHNTHSLARVYEGQGDWEKAQNLYNKTLQINQTVKDSLIELLSLYGQSCNFQKQERYEEGIIAARKSALLSIALGREDFESLNYYQIGLLNQYSGALDSAIFYLKKASTITADQPFSSVRNRCYRHLAKCYSLKKEFKPAYFYSQRHAEHLDSITQKQRSDDLDKLTIEYETQQKQLTIQQLEKEQAQGKLENERKKSLFTPPFLHLNPPLYFTCNSCKVLSRQNSKG